MKERSAFAAIFTGMNDMARMILSWSSAVLAVGLAAVPAGAAQSLIATPYPGAIGGNAQVLDPEPQALGGPQHLNDDPYPQILGENAQGNAPIIRRHRHQHLVRSINQRKYRVDRH